MVNKVCYRCHLAKELNEYHVDKSKVDGRVAVCKECKKEVPLWQLKTWKTGLCLFCFYYKEDKEQNTLVGPKDTLKVHFN